MKSEAVQSKSCLMHQLDGKCAQHNMLGRQKLEKLCTPTATPRTIDVIYRLAQLWKWPTYQYDYKHKRNLRKYERN